jgi:hypothetical protein
MQSVIYLIRLHSVLLLYLIDHRALLGDGRETGRKED